MIPRIGSAVPTVQHSLWRQKTEKLVQRWVEEPSWCSGDGLLLAWMARQERCQGLKQKAYQKVQSQLLRLVSQWWMWWWMYLQRCLSFLHPVGCSDLGPSASGSASKSGSVQIKSDSTKHQKPNLCYKAALKTNSNTEQGQGSCHSISFLSPTPAQVKSDPGLPEEHTRLSS
jgi:hypothetical protein